VGGVVMCRVIGGAGVYRVVGGAYLRMRAKCEIEMGTQ